MLRGSVLLSFAIAALNVACESAPPRDLDRMAIQGESLVLVDQQPGKLSFESVDDVVVRSRYEAADPRAVVYVEGQDYVLDRDAGTLTRTADSRIPNYSTHVLHGVKEFDHAKYRRYRNHPFFVWVDYTTAKGSPLAEPSNQTAQLARTRSRLESGGAFKLLIYGDSISAGGEVSAERLQFGQRYAAWLRERFPKAQIEVENAATGGDSTIQGLQRLEEKVLSRNPDLVVLGFGMNDHNKGWVEPEAFEENLVTMIHRIREPTGADVLVHSAFPPNPNWIHSSHRMEQYAQASRRAAERTNSAYADVYGVWEKVLKRKDFPSLLGNNINHPNDWGHGLYFKALQAVEF